MKRAIFVVNIYANTNLKVELQPEKILVKQSGEIKISVRADLNLGSIQMQRGFARIVSPAFNIADLLPADRVAELGETDRIQQAIFA